MQKIRFKLATASQSWLSSLLVVALAAGILSFGGVLTQATPESGRAPPMRELPVVTVCAMPSDHYVVNRTFLGRIESRQQSSLSFEVAGKLTSVLVDEGEIVSEGQLLAQLDTQILRSQRDSLVAQVAAAKSKLDELVNGSRIEVLQAAEANVENWQAQRKLAESTRRRLENLLASNAVAHQQSRTQYMENSQQKHNGRPRERASKSWLTALGKNRSRNRGRFGNV